VSGLARIVMLVSLCYKVLYPDNMYRVMLDDSWKSAVLYLLVLSF